MTYTPKTHTIYSNYRIEVVPQELRSYNYNYNYKRPEEKHKAMLRALEELRIDANRHLEHHDGISSHFDREVCCRFCGTPWEDAVDDEGVPWCCAEAMDDYAAQTGREDVISK